MSESIVIALIAALTGSFVGSVVTALMSLRITKINLDAQEQARRDDHAHQERLKAQEDAEWYKRQVFEKRLTAVQEANVWLRKLSEAMTVAQNSEQTLEANQTLQSFAGEARRWYDANSLLLQDKLPTSSSFVGLTNTAGRYAASVDKDPRDVKQFWNMFSETDEYISERAEFLLSSKSA